MSDESLVVELELVVVDDDELHEALVGPTNKESSIMSHVSPISQVTITCSSLD
jgi:hypothetical protein